ncbi:hypothetical protein EsH8_XV_000002 [Colletotrichum jinshuiense]
MSPRCCGPVTVLERVQPDHSDLFGIIVGAALACVLGVRAQGKGATKRIIGLPIDAATVRVDLSTSDGVPGVVTPKGKTLCWAWLQMKRKNLRTLPRATPATLESTPAQERITQPSTAGACSLAERPAVLQLSQILRGSTGSYPASVVHTVHSSVSDSLRWYQAK